MPPARSTEPVPCSTQPVCRSWERMGRCWERASGCRERVACPLERASGCRERTARSWERASGCKERTVCSWEQTGCSLERMSRSWLRMGCSERGWGRSVRKNADFGWPAARKPLQRARRGRYTADGFMGSRAILILWPRSQHGAEGLSHAESHSHFGRRFGTCGADRRLRDGREMTACPITFHARTPISTGGRPTG